MACLSALLILDEICEKLRSVDPDKPGVEFSKFARDQINVLQDQSGDDFDRILVRFGGAIFER